MLAASFLLLGVLAQKISATVYYVDANRGCKTNNGKSLDEPFATIQECVDALLEPGDECRIRAGRYHENVSIHGKYGSDDKPIIIGGYNNEQPIIDGYGVIATQMAKVPTANIQSDDWSRYLATICGR